MSLSVQSTEPRSGAGAPKTPPNPALRGAEPQGHRGDVAATDFEQAVIRLFTDTADLLGVPKSVAMIYGVLFASPAPLTFAEIEARLGISKGSVSQGLRFLREIGAVRPAERDQAEGLTGDASSAEGGRNPATYEPVVELRKLLARLIADKLQPQIKASGERIEELHRLLSVLSPTESAVLAGRLKHLHVWQRRSREFLPLLKTFLAVSGGNRR